MLPWKGKGQPGFLLSLLKKKKEEKKNKSMHGRFVIRDCTNRISIRGSTDSGPRAEDDQSVSLLQTVASGCPHSRVRRVPYPGSPDAGLGIRHPQAGTEHPENLNATCA
jgi:hypothetical protein